MTYKLPPLPELTQSCEDEGYTAEQMQAYAIAAIEAQGVPDGWQLAPKEPTQAMAKAAADAWLDCGSKLLLNKSLSAIRAALASAPPAPQAEKAHSLPSAVKTVIAAMKEDPDYAWSWHCNVAMAFVDAGGDSYIANQGAARFMRSLAGVEPAHELPAPQAEDWETRAELAEQAVVRLSEERDHFKALYYALKEQAAVAQQEPDDGGDLLTIAYLHGFAKGKDAAADPPAPQAKPQPLSDEQIVPMFSRRADMPVKGEKDPWFWYAWGVEDGEAAHGITRE